MTDVEQSEGGFKWMMPAIAVSVIALAAGGWYAYTKYGKQSAAIESSAAAQTVAIVENQIIPRGEVDIMVANGINPAVARDAAIQRAVLALAADQKYPEDAKLATQSVAREAKAQVFLAKESDALMKAVTDEEIQKWYDANVIADDFKQVRARFYQSASLEDALAVAAAANRGETQAIAKYTSLSKDAGGFVTVGDIPYGLGRNVIKQRLGSYEQPVMTRTGAVSFVVDEVRSKEKPALADVKDNIRRMLANAKLADLITKLRAEMKIELKG